jgi:hypothetical protein
MNTDVASIPIEYTQQKHKFRIDSSDKEKIDFSVLTDAGAGLTFESNGNTNFYTNNESREIVGRKIQKPPGTCIPAKLIQAKGGDIFLEAEQGDIYLRGRNIFIVAKDALGGEVVIDSNKIIQMNAPVVNTQAENVTTVASGTLNLGAGAITKNGEIINEDTTGTDEIKASFFGKILSGLKKFKKFFNSKCG